MLRILVSLLGDFVINPQFFTAAKQWLNLAFCVCTRKPVLLLLELTLKHVWYTVASSKNHYITRSDIGINCSYLLMAERACVCVLGQKVPSLFGAGVSSMEDNSLSSLSSCFPHWTCPRSCPQARHEQNSSSPTVGSEVLISEGNNNKVGVT